MDLPQQTHSPLAVVAGKVSMLTLDLSFLWVPLGGEAKVLLKMSKANAEYVQYKESEEPHRDSEIPLCCRKYRHCEAQIFM